MICVAIVSHKRPQALSSLLSNWMFINGLERQQATCIVLAQQFDDQSERAMRAVMQTNIRSGLLWGSPHNYGCGGGRQRIVDMLLGKRDAQAVVFLDDDIQMVSPIWLQTLTAPILHGQAMIAGAAGRVITSDWLTEPCGDKLPDYVSGGWCCVSMRLFERGIEFDPAFNPNYWEDVDLCLQAARLGYQIVEVKGTGLVHPDHAISPESAASFERNRAYIRAKWEAIRREQQPRIATG